MRIQRWGVALAMLVAGCVTPGGAGPQTGPDSPSQGFPESFLLAATDLPSGWGLEDPARISGMDANPAPLSQEDRDEFAHVGVYPFLASANESWMELIVPTPGVEHDERIVWLVASRWEDPATFSDLVGYLDRAVAEDGCEDPFGQDSRFLLGDDVVVLFYWQDLSRGEAAPVFSASQARMTTLRALCA